MDLWSGSIPTGSFDLSMCPDALSRSKHRAILIIPLLTIIETFSDIKLVNATPKRDHTIPQKSRLSFHSFVNPALIPLYARAGPSVEVHTANVESAEWLKTKLLGNLWLEELGNVQEDEMERAGVEIQCPVALLLTVDSSSQAVGDVSHNANTTNNVSDLLVYGILMASYPNQDRLPSPSGSASGDGHQPVESSRRRELRIYAAPLATSYVQKAQDLPSPPSSPIEGDNNRSCAEDGLVAQFLPDLRSPTPKRKRMLSIFETAAQHHRRVRQYGGQAVSQLMATTKSQTHQTQPLKIKREPTDDGGSSSSKPGLDRLGGLRRARSLSIGGSHLARLDNTRVGADENRPSSSRGLQQQARRMMISKNDGASHSFHEFERSRSIAPTSNLASYNEAAAATAIDYHDSSTLSSSSPETGEMLVASNKDVITRAILTGMRLYGYHRKPNRAAAASKPATIVNELDGIGEDGAITPTMAEDCSKQSTTDEDNFKAMYHATYKAATFALRHYLKADTILNNNDNGDSTKGTGPAVLSRDTATNVIDEILKLFCDDQLKPAG